MVVDAVLCHWITVVAESEEAVPLGAASMEVFGRDMQRLTAYFYADDRILELMRVTCIQRNFDILMELFNRVGLLANVTITVIMACHTCCALRGYLLEACGLLMIGEIYSFWYRLCQRVRCPYCDAYLPEG